MSSSILVNHLKRPKLQNVQTIEHFILMSHILKILLRMILKQNKHKIESVIETQSGFMAGKGTREGIYNLRTIIERYIKKSVGTWEEYIYISVSLTMKRLSTESNMQRLLNAWKT